MKKTLLAIALMSASGIALACQGSSCDTNVNSSASGSVGSQSMVYGANGVSAHFATAASRNETCVDGFKLSGPLSAASGTHAETSGSTVTSAGGFGFGGAGAGANQAGYGEITKSASPWLTRGEATTTSAVGTSTGSGAYVLNNGFAVSGSRGEAENTSLAGASKNCLFGCSNATGTSVGGDKVETWGGSTYGYGDYVTAGGSAGQEGSYNARIGNTSSSN